MVDIFNRDQERKKRLGQAKQRKQGGIGGSNNTAGDGALLGGDPNAVKPVKTSRLGSTITDSGKIRTDFSSSGSTGGTASVITSPQAAGRFSSPKNTGGSFSTLDFSGLRNEQPGARAELNAIQAGKRAGLAPQDILLNARQAKINSLPSGIEKEIERISFLRDTGELNPLTATEQLNNLFRLKTAEDEVGLNREEFKSGQQQDQLKLQFEREKQKAKQIADRETLLAQSDLKSSAEKAQKQKNLVKSRLDTLKLVNKTKEKLTENFGDINKNPEALKQVFDIGLASVSPQLDEFKSLIKSPASKEEKRSAYNSLKAELKARGIDTDSIPDGDKFLQQFLIGR